MAKWNGWDTNPIRYQPLPGKEVKDDGTVLGVPEWREDNIVKLVAIKDEINDEQAATRQTIIDEHTTTRATIESVGEEIEANNTAEHTSTRATITTKSDEEQVKLDALEDSLTSMEAREEAKEQNRNGQQHQRVYDPTSARLLGEILGELKKMNTQLEFITDEKIR